MAWTTEWTTQAGCRNADPDALFVQGAAQNRAKALCFGCPVRAECLNGAVDEGDDWSIRGGTTAKERRNLTHTRR